MASSRLRSPQEQSLGAGSDDLGPIGDMLVLPKAVDLGLRTRGLDPSTMRAGEFVLTLLELFEYDVTSGELPGTYTASKGGRRTYHQRRAACRGWPPGAERVCHQSVHVRLFIVRR